MPRNEITEPVSIPYTRQGKAPLVNDAGMLVSFLVLRRCSMRALLKVFVLFMHIKLVFSVAPEGFSRLNLL